MGMICIQKIKTEIAINLTTMHAKKSGIKS
jgi:hypothetical protein